VLQRIDFSGDKETIRQWCEQLASEYVVLHAAEAGRQAWQMIERFLGSERGRQIAKATAIHREVEFLLAWPPDNIGDHSEQSRIHGHYLQGYMDCLYQNSPEGWHLLDYKTNDISAAEVPQVARRYEMQLYVYALAIERSLGIPPLELVLHFLRPGIEYCLPWNDEARHRAAQLINEAITALVSSSNSDL
jgi:ATP-dependent exoDNAse (exonuclease V) beta subunit